MEPAAAVRVHVLGHVGQEGEQAERASHMQRLFDGQPVDEGGELRIRSSRAAGIDGDPTNAFHQLVDMLTRLFPNDIADQSAEKPYVGIEMGIFSGARIERLIRVHPDGCGRR